MAPHIPFMISESEHHILTHPFVQTAVDCAPLVSLQAALCLARNSALC